MFSFGLFANYFKTQLKIVLAMLGKERERDRSSTSACLFCLLKFSVLCFSWCQRLVAVCGRLFLFVVCFEVAERPSK